VAGTARKKAHTPEEIVAKLRQSEVLIGQGKTVVEAVRSIGVTERKACAVLGQHSSTQRKAPRTAEDEAALTAGVVDLAKRYGRYGYWRITALLRDAGSAVNRKRVERVRGTASDAEGSGTARV
jgi:hypothetical protein